MKKLLLLGGSTQQIIAIKKAKQLGYFTILCDYLFDNPGQFVADKFYLASTTDKDAILKIASKEKIDGIIAYASDPAAPTAAYVSEILGLKTNPFEAVRTLCLKDKFRSFLLNNNFNCPKMHSFNNINDALQFEKNLNFPVIVKPVDSSGSKGVTVICQNRINMYKKAVDFAFQFSKQKKIIVERFIKKNHKYLIGGDIFVIDGEVVLWGLLNCHRDDKTNNLVPAGKSYPLFLNSKQEHLVKVTLMKLVKKLNINYGALNVELIIDDSNKVYLLDVGPRAGGNMIPDFLGKIFDIDIVEAIIELTLDNDYAIKPNRNTGVWSTYNLHVNKNGVFKKIIYDLDFRKFIVDEIIYVKKGDVVRCFNNASDALGILFLKFNDVEIKEQIINNIDDYINIEII